MSLQRDIGGPLGLALVGGIAGLFIVALLLRAIRGDSAFARRSDGEAAVDAAASATAGPLG